MLKGLRKKKAVKATQLERSRYLMTLEAVTAGVLDRAM
jgi:hypothetical protein